MRKRQSYLKPTTTVLHLDMSHALLAGSNELNKYGIKVDEKDETSGSGAKEENPDEIDANKNSGIWSDEIWK